jgi:site-specific DNA-cytosine methylase
MRCFTKLCYTMLRYALLFYAIALRRCYMLKRVQAEEGHACLLHPHRAGGCQLPGAVDVVVGCGPCQPFTSLRQGCGASSPTLHPLFQVTFGKSGSILSLLAAVETDYFLSEQVLGFSHLLKAEDSSFLDLFVTSVNEVVSPLGESRFQGHARINLDPKAFVDGSRPRFLRETIYRQSERETHGVIERDEIRENQKVCPNKKYRKKTQHDTHTHAHTHTHTHTHAYTNSFLQVIHDLVQGRWRRPSTLDHSPGGGAFFYLCVCEGILLVHVWRGI